MRERPILFSGAMVRAILDGTKTQTRRVVKARRFDPAGRDDESQSGWCTVSPEGGWTPELIAREYPCPYGAIGDRLWVRETWGEFVRRPGVPVYRADDPNVLGSPNRWRSPIHMPRWASRITLEIADVRVERVQAIREADACAEGVEMEAWDQAPVARKYDEQDAWFQMWSQDLPHYRPCEELARASFHSLWDSLNAKRGYGWDQNPWVWALTFRRIEEGARDAE